MLARSTLRATARVGSVTVSAPSNERGMATLRELEMRLKSMKNMEKITKSMKMIASTKLNKAQRALEAGKVYGLANTEINQHTTLGEESGKRRLFIVISSDKGMCGGIHSSVSKFTRRSFAGTESALAQPDTDSPIMVVGDKSKSQLARVLGNNLAMSFNQIGKDVPTFADAAGVADLVARSGVEYDSVAIVYNRFVSALSYEPAVMEVRPEAALTGASGFESYEVADEVAGDLAQFQLANAIYAALVEGHACEISARRNAMDNASKNAGDMIGKLNLQYNRGRQAKITSELVDIITGASAL
jgi:F-type H+-transporting ATPase subunit gamma